MNAEAEKARAKEREEQRQWDAFVAAAAVADESWEAIEAMAAANAARERRIDPGDGRAYTKEEMVQFYGGEDEWNEARKEGEDEADWKARLDRMEVVRRRREFRRKQREEEERRRQERLSQQAELRAQRVREAKEARDLLRRKEEERAFWLAKEEADRKVRERLAREAEARRREREAEEARARAEEEKRRAEELAREAERKRRLKEKEEDEALARAEEEKVAAFRAAQAKRLEEAEAAHKAREAAEEEERAKKDAERRRRESRERARREEAERERKKAELEALKRLEEEAEAERRARLTSAERRAEDLKRKLQSGASFAKVKENLAAMKASMARAEEEAAAARVRAAEAAAAAERAAAERFFEERRRANEEKRAAERAARAKAARAAAERRRREERYEADADEAEAGRRARWRQTDRQARMREDFERERAARARAGAAAFAAEMRAKAAAAEAAVIERRRALDAPESPRVAVEGARSPRSPLASPRGPGRRRRRDGSGRDGSKRRNKVRRRWLDVLTEGGRPEPGGRVLVDVLRFRAPGRAPAPEEPPELSRGIDGGAALVRVVPGQAAASQHGIEDGRAEWVSARHLWRMREGGLDGPPARNATQWMDVWDGELGMNVGRVAVRVVNGGDATRAKAKVEVLPSARAEALGFEGGETEWVVYAALWPAEAGFARPPGRLSGARPDAPGAAGPAPAAAPAAAGARVRADMDRIAVSAEETKGDEGAAAEPQPPRAAAEAGAEAADAGAEAGAGPARAATKGHRRGMAAPSPRGPKARPRRAARGAARAGGACGACDLTPRPPRPARASLPPASSARPLFSAAEVGNDAAIRRTLAAGGVSVDARTDDASGATALMIAARMAHSIAANVLLQHGADVSLTTRNSRETCLHWALASVRASRAGRVGGSRAGGRGELRAPLGPGPTAAAWASARGGVGPSAPSRSMHTCATKTFAVLLGAVDALAGRNAGDGARRGTTDGGAPPGELPRRVPAVLDAATREGMTALHYAAFHRRPEEGIALLERGASASARDAWRRTALDIARSLAAGSDGATSGTAPSDTEAPGKGSSPAEPEAGAWKAGAWKAFLSALEAQMRREDGELAEGERLGRGERVRARRGGGIAFINARVLRCLPGDKDRHDFEDRFNDCYDLRYSTGETERDVPARLVRRGWRADCARPLLPEHIDRGGGFSKSIAPKLRKLQRESGRVRTEVEGLRRSLEEEVERSRAAKRRLRRGERQVERSRAMRGDPAKR
jgi:hypothetical protein